MRGLFLLLAVATVVIGVWTRRRQQRAARVSPRWLHEHAYDRVARWREVSR